VVLPEIPLLQKMGYPDGVYRVGPLGRLNIADKIDTPLANDELKIFKSLNNGKPVENTLYYHYARLIEASSPLNARVSYAKTPIFSAPIFSTPARITQATA
jgi:NAD-reducing hydrogenase large subunit